MDKNTLIRMLRNGTFNEFDIITIISEYCIEKGKNPKDIQNFISIILPINPHYYFNYALDYYKKKFELISVIDREGKILLTY